MAYETRDIPDHYEDGILAMDKIGERTYIIYYNDPDQQIALTGSLTNYDFRIPFAFRIEYIIICADDATAKDIDIYVFPYFAKALAYPPRLLSKSSDIEKDRIVKYGREYKFPCESVIRFALNGTATKKIFLLVGIQRLGP
ncbi:MAG: hypothetical protein HWN68_15210 [Desulfobacterales bacterium]|nr:hypothetical protein [Desulfobacterales bacterium]